MRLEINDPYEILYSYNLEELPSGIITLSVNGFTSYFCQIFNELKTDTIYFYDEETSWQECSIKLVIDNVNVNTKYVRYALELYSESHDFIFVPIELLNNEK